MKTGNILIIIGIIVSSIYESQSYRCDRIPLGVSKPRNPNVAGKYLLDIPGNPKTYRPNENYNSKYKHIKLNKHKFKCIKYILVSLKVDPYSMTPRTFKGFIVTLEQHITYNLLANDIVRNTGQFHFGEDMLAKFSDKCPNTVVESNSLPKTEVHVRNFDTKI